MKYTSLFVVALLVLSLIGVMIEPGAHSVLFKDRDVNKSIKNFLSFNSGGGGTRALLLVIGSLTLVGCANLVFYTGFGLMALPISMIRGRKRLDEERLTVDLDRINLKKKRDELEQKYLSSSRFTRESDRRELSKLELQAKMKEKQRRNLSTVDTDLTYRFFQLLTPFRCLFGFLFLLCSLLIFVSLFISALDAYLHSSCGLSCGYFLDHHQFMIPLDLALIYASQYFPLDYGFFAGLCIYIFLVSLYAILRLGVRFLGLQLFSLRRRRSWPQALLLSSLLMILILLALIMLLLTLSPSYVSFGSQVYWNVEMKSWQQCTLVASTSLPPPMPISTNSSLLDVAGSVAIATAPSARSCVLTNISLLFHQLTLAFPLFSMLFYCVNWLFLCVVVLSAIYEMCRDKSSYFVDDYASDDDQEMANLMEDGAI